MRVTLGAVGAAQAFMEKILLDESDIEYSVSTAALALPLLWLQSWLQPTASASRRRRQATTERRKPHLYSPRLPPVCSA